MNFSFLGISIKSPNDLFSWHRIKSTLLLNWYVFWRLALIYLSVIVLVIGLVIFGYPAESIMIYGKNPWLQFLWILLLTLTIFFLSYKALYSKSYRSFILTLNESASPRFWSWYFWKRNILLNIAILPYVFVERNMSSIFICYGLSLLISHICLHCGFWGVTHQPKRIKDI